MDLRYCAPRTALFAVLVADLCCGSAQAGDLKAGNIHILHSDPGTVSKGLQPQVQDQVDGAFKHIGTCWNEEFDHHVGNLRLKINAINAHILRLKSSMDAQGADTETPNPGTDEGADLIQSRGDVDGIKDIIDKLKKVWRRYCPQEAPMMDVHPLPKSNVKSKQGVSEDSPLYMDGYKAPQDNKPVTHKKSGDDGTGPSQDDVDRQTEKPANEDDRSPQIPVPK